MDTLLQQNEKKSRNYKGLLAGALVGLVIIAAGVWLMSLRPSMKDQQAAVLEGSYTEGSPEYEELNRDIIISTHRDTVESPNAFGLDLDVH
jgi:hypothetical protein